jgi:malate dehydrogenase
MHMLQIVPLLSQSSHPLPASVGTERLEALTNRIQFGGDEVVKAKDGTGSATLSMAYAGAEFATKVIRALAGEKGIVAPSYVHLDADREGGAALRREIGRDLDYFSTNIEIGVSPLQRLCYQRAAHHFRDSPTVSRGSFPLEI